MRDLSEPFSSWRTGVRLGLTDNRWSLLLGASFERGRSERAAGSILLRAVYFEAAVRRQWRFTEITDWTLQLGYELGQIWLQGEPAEEPTAAAFRQVFGEQSGAVGQLQLWTGPELRWGDLRASLRAGGGYTLPRIRANVVDERFGDERPVTVHGFSIGAEVTLGVTW